MKDRLLGCVRQVAGVCDRLLGCVRQVAGVCETGFRVARVGAGIKVGSDELTEVKRMEEHNCGRV